MPATTSAANVTAFVNVGVELMLASEHETHHLPWRARFREPPALIAPPAATACDRVLWPSSARAVHACDLSLESARLKPATRGVPERRRVEKLPDQGMPLGGLRVELAGRLGVCLVPPVRGGVRVPA